MALADDVAEGDVVALHPFLRALANPGRLQLLWKLREPQHQAQVRVEAPDRWGEFRPGRYLSRSTVAEHVAVLEELGLVTRLPDTGEVVVNQQRVVAIVHRLGALARLRPEVATDVEATVKVGERPRGDVPEGPKLVLVSGPEAGSWLPLPGGGPWRLGRSHEAEVQLAYDPHVSSLQALVERDDEGMYRVRALPGTTNDILLDFEPLAPGRAELLIPGSVLSAGSSRLVFKAL